MSDTLLIFVVGTIATGLTLFCTWIGTQLSTWINNRRTKNDQTESLIITLLRDRIVSLEAQAKKDRQDIDDLTDNEIKCREDNARLTEQVKFLIQQIADIRLLLKPNTTTLEKPLAKPNIDSGDSGIIN